MNEDGGKVSEMNDELYSRTLYKAPDDKRSPIEAIEEPEVGDSFRGPQLAELLAHERIKSTEHPMMKRVFIFALVFCILAGGIATFIYFGGGNFISSKNVDITVNGPVSISAGDPVELSIIITNTNNADLTLATMSVDYPSGTRSADDVTVTLSHTKTAIGSLGLGQSITETERYQRNNHHR